MPTVIVVGAGPVGSLAAARFAEHGWSVTLVEARADLRAQAHTRERSINLALSHRGMESLRACRAVDMARVMADALPMRGRMVHAGSGLVPRSQPYGTRGEAINSIDRRMLNAHLMDAAERAGGVVLRFEHTLTAIDWQAGTATFHDRVRNKTVTLAADLVVGADGAHSVVRRELLRPAMLDFHQRYIDHAYLEITMPAKQGGGWRMDKEHLHIWPRLEYMLIALPNPDGSFTCTLFAPWSLFEAVQTPKDLLALWETEFPGTLELFGGMEHLEREFFGNPRGPLITIKCDPHHYQHRAVLIGDAAHAMVPFYGQGMNCGFEDVAVLFRCLANHSGAHAADPKALAAALREYSDSRPRDTAAMCDMALANYEEMRANVVHPVYLVRRAIERMLHRVFPRFFTPLYTLVAFTSTPYAECVKRGARVRCAANAVLCVAGSFLACGVGGAVQRLMGVRTSPHRGDMWAALVPPVLLPWATQAQQHATDAVGRLKRALAI